MSTVVVSRPRSAAEILDATARLVRAHYGPLVALSALCYVPLATAQMVFFPAAGQFTGASKLTPHASLVFFGWTVFAIVWSRATLAPALTVATSAAYIEGTIQTRKALSETARRVPSTLALAVLWTALLAAILLACLIPAGLIVGVLLAIFHQGLNPLISGVIVLAAPGICLGYFVAAMCAALPVVVLEGKSAVESLRRSVRLTQHLRAHVVGVLVSLGAAYLGLFISMVVLFKVGGVRPEIQKLVGVVVFVVVYPFVVGAEVVLYYDLRIRKEAYDIELMARATSQPAEPQPA